MANTQYAYVRDFELPDPLLPETFIIFRLDGRSFHRFSDNHGFAKPNDIRALKLMDHVAKDVIEEHPDIVLAFGESDEYSFLLRRSTTLYNRRQSKIVSILTSYFSACYVFRWTEYFPDTPLQYPPCFDGRIILYPSAKHIRDYFAWRQADTHINNLYNTTFWALVHQAGQTTTQAHATLKGTFSKDKHEILFSRFNINYNNVDPRFRKGSVLYRQEVQQPKGEEASTAEPLAPGGEDGARIQAHEKVSRSETKSGEIIQSPKKSKRKQKQPETTTTIELQHCDIIRDEFWARRRWLLEE